MNAGSGGGSVMHLHNQRHGFWTNFGRILDGMKSSHVEEAGHLGQASPPTAEAAGEFRPAPAGGNGAQRPRRNRAALAPEQLMRKWRALVRSRSGGDLRLLVLLLSCLAMMTGFPASSVLTRLYYVDGGSSKWLVSWLAPAGWPLTAAILLGFCAAKGERLTPLSWDLAAAYAVLGLLSFGDNLAFAYAYSYLPASTAALLASTSLAFTAVLAYFIVDQRFNSSIVNAVGLMTSAAVILALDSSSDRPPGVTSRQYAVGFVLTIAASAVHGLIFALSELLFMARLGRHSLRLVLEVQTATSVFTTLFTTIGILIAGDFGGVREEARRFKHGPSAYYQVFVWLAITFQLGILGSVGCLFLANTLLAGVLNAGRVPATAIAAVIIFNDPMGGFKILAIVLTVWSFASYVWGVHQQQRERKRLESENPPSLPTSRSEQRRQSLDNS